VRNLKALELMIGSAGPPQGAERALGGQRT
jgi:hypothetical protein